MLDNIRHKLPANANGLNASRGDLCNLCNEISLNNVMSAFIITVVNYGFLFELGLHILEFLISITCEAH